MSWYSDRYGTSSSDHVYGRILDEDVLGRCEQVCVTGQEVDMQHNMSNLDRGLRAFLVAPAAVVVGVLLGPASVLAILLYVVAGVMLATSAIGFCPLYTLLHIDTRGRKPLAH